MTRDEVAAALADIHNIEGVNAVAVVVAVDLALPLWRVADAARAFVAAADADNAGDSQGLLLAEIDAENALRAALADLDAVVEVTE